MKYIFSQYIRTSQAALILICDDLHAYNLIIRGKSPSIEHAFKAARNQGENLCRMILNVRSQFTDVENVCIAKWRDIAGQDNYMGLLQRLSSVVEEDKDLAAVVDQFVVQHVRKFCWRSDEQAAKWEKRYLLEEITMSIYVTEMLGYPRELWESPPNPQFADPIGYLYESRPELVQMLVGKRTLSRKLEILVVT